LQPNRVVGGGEPVVQLGESAEGPSASRSQDVSTAPIESLPRTERRRLVAVGLVRALTTTVVAVAAYYLLPLKNLAGISLGVVLAVGLLVLAAVVAYQVRAIIRHPHSAVRAIEALAITVPVFLLLFAATYFMMEQTNPDNFNVDSLTRTDSLYFTVTVFATVGFGDITATSQVARVVVIAQMILDLLVLGLVVKVFVGAVETGRGLQRTRQDSESS
jgi:voltage-gated potassium channel